MSYSVYCINSNMCSLSFCSNFDSWPISVYTLGFWTMCSIQSDNLWSFQFGARKLTRQLHFNKYKPSWISMKLLSCLLLSVSGNSGKKILWKFIHRTKHFSEDLLNLMNRTYGADCWNKEIHKISLNMLWKRLFWIFYSQDHNLVPRVLSYPP